MKHFLRLIRWKNLLMIALTFVLLRYCIVRAIIRVNSFELVFPDYLFAMLVLAVIFIAAGGYVINDYFDTETDRVNGKNNPIPEQINPQTAITLYLLFSIIGFGLGLYVSIKAGYPRFSLIFFIAASLLWFYSSAFKKSFLIGNIIIAFLTGLIPMLIAIYDVPALMKAYKTDILIYGINFNIATYWMAGYALFAAGFTLIREIVKDLQDLEGDKAIGANTLPVAAGEKIAKAIVVILNLALMALLIYVFITYLSYVWSLVYLAVFLVVPDLLFLIIFLRAKTPGQYALAGNVLKFIMLSGILYSVLACYIFSLI